jgi:hypothetical protein
MSDFTLNLKSDLKRPLNENYFKEKRKIKIVSVKELQVLNEIHRSILIFTTMLRNEIAKFLSSKNFSKNYLLDHHFKKKVR